jgi:hypothetical protein
MTPGMIDAYPSFSRVPIYSFQRSGRASAAGLPSIASRKWTSK